MSFSSVTIVRAEGDIQQDVHCLHLHDGQREEAGGGGEGEEGGGEEHQHWTAEGGQPELERGAENPRDSIQQCDGRAPSPKKHWRQWCYKVKIRSAVNTCNCFPFASQTR